MPVIPKNRRRVALVAVGILVALLVLIFGVGQIVLPKIAEGELSSLLKDEGAQGTEISLIAVPAVQVLFGHADSVTLKANRMTLGNDGSDLSQLSRAGEVNAKIGTLNTRWVQLSDVSLSKQPDGSVAIAGLLTRSELDRQAPPGVAIADRKAAPNEVPLEIGGGLLPNNLVKPALVIKAEDGAARLSLDATGIPFGPSLISITVFNDPDLNIEHAALAARASGWELVIEGQLT